MRGSINPTGFIGPNRKVSTSASRDFFNRQTALKKLGLVFHPRMRFDFFRDDQRIVEAIIFLFVHRAIDVIVAAFAVARGFECDLVIDRFAFNDRRNRIEEI